VAETVIDGGQVRVSGQITVTLKLQNPVLVLESVAEQFTVVVPTGKVEPDGGLQLTGNDPSQASLADAE
jgi:hypothetical protein